MVEGTPPPSPSKRPFAHPSAAWDQTSAAGGECKKKSKVKGGGGGDPSWLAAAVKAGGRRALSNVPNIYFLERAHEYVLLHIREAASEIAGGTVIMYLTCTVHTCVVVNCNMVTEGF